MFSFFQTIFTKITSAIASVIIAVGLVSVPAIPKEPQMPLVEEKNVVQEVSKDQEGSALETEVKELRAEVKELKEQKEVTDANTKSTNSLDSGGDSEAITRSPYNTILCNGIYWSLCPEGQSFYCPATGDAQCVEKNIQPSSVSSSYPRLKELNNCWERGMQEYEREKERRYTEYEQCKKENPDISGLILCSPPGIGDYISGCGAGSSSLSGSTYLPPSYSSLLDTSINVIDRLREDDQANRLKELERKQWELEQEQYKKDNQDFFNCINSGGSYLSGTCRYY